MSGKAEAALLIVMAIFTVPSHCSDKSNVSAITGHKDIFSSIECLQCNLRFTRQTCCLLINICCLWSFPLYPAIIANDSSISTQTSTTVPSTVQTTMTTSTPTPTTTFTTTTTSTLFSETSTLQQPEATKSHLEPTAFPPPF